MKTIWKYELQVTDVQTIEVPTGAQFLSVQAQRERLCMWCLVDPENKRRQAWSLRIVGTGHEFDAIGNTFLGTVQMAGGSLVWHVFKE